MNFNPYEPAESQPATRLPPFLLDEQVKGRLPWGLILLGLWFLAQALVPAAAIILLLAIGEAPPLFTLGLPLFVIGLKIAVAIGLWRGENWGWRGASFFCVIQVVQPILHMVRGFQPDVWSLIEAVVGVGAFLYLFNDRVLHYFGMYGIHKLHTARRIIVICCILLAIITFTN